jgi:hypothetical protein
VGRVSGFENVRNSPQWRLSGRLAHQSGELGFGGKGDENGAPGPPFSATFSQVTHTLKSLLAAITFGLQWERSLSAQGTALL